MSLPLAIGLGVLAGLAAYALVLAVFLLRRIGAAVGRIEASPFFRIVTRSKDHAEEHRG